MGNPLFENRERRARATRPRLGDVTQVEIFGAIQHRDVVESCGPISSPETLSMRR